MHLTCIYNFVHSLLIRNDLIITQFVLSKLIIYLSNSNKDQWIFYSIVWLIISNTIQYVYTVQYEY